MHARATKQKIFFTALVVALLCSAFVSVSTILLRPAQENNRQQFMYLNILKAAGLFQKDVAIDKQLQQLEIQLIELPSGRFHEVEQPQAWDMYKAAKDPAQSDLLTPEQDTADIKRRPKYAPVYFTRDDNRRINRIILPIHGYGLWSTLYGFIALQGDTTTVIGIRFYDHAETPGLGGEVDSARWLKQWQGKKMYNTWWQPSIRLVKGGVNHDDPATQHQVDALSGATLTNRGVENILKFWMGNDGFGPFLARLRKTSGSL